MTDKKEIEEIMKKWEKMIKVDKKAKAESKKEYE